MIPTRTGPSHEERQRLTTCDHRCPAGGPNRHELARVAICHGFCAGPNQPPDSLGDSMGRQNVERPCHRTDGPGRLRKHRCSRRRSVGQCQYRHERWLSLRVAISGLMEPLKARCPPASRPSTCWTKFSLSGAAMNTSGHRSGSFGVGATIVLCRSSDGLSAAKHMVARVARPASPLSSTSTNAADLPLLSKVVLIRTFPLAGPTNETCAERSGARSAYSRCTASRQKSCRKPAVDRASLQPIVADCYRPITSIASKAVH